MAANGPLFMLLLFDVHVAILKLLNLRDALAYAQIGPVYTVRFLSPCTA